MEKLVKAHQVNLFVAGLYKDLPNIRLENFVKLTDLQRFDNFFILSTCCDWKRKSRDFEETFMEKIVKALQVNLFVAGFSHLKPQWADTRPENSLQHPPSPPAFCSFSNSVPLIVSGLSHQESLLSKSFCWQSTPWMDIFVADSHLNILR